MQVLLVCFCRLYLRNHITLLADEAVRKHLKVDSTGSCTNSADANCIHVRHYKFIMFSPHHWHSMECVLLLQMSWRRVIYVCVFLFGTSGGGSQPPPHQIWGLGKRCKLSQRGPGRSLGRCKVFLHSRGAREPLLELVGGQVRGAWLPCPPPLNPPVHVVYRCGTDRCPSTRTPSRTSLTSRLITCCWSIQPPTTPSTTPLLG